MDLKNIKFDVIIIAGQSNAEGYGRSNDEITIVNDAFEAIDFNECYIEVDETKPFYEQAKIHMVLPPKIKIQPLQERYNGCDGTAADLSLSFVPLYQKHFLENDRKVIVVKTAIGGTGFARRQQGVNYEVHKRCLSMVDQVLGLNPENRVVALLWHQGEHDAFEFPEKDNEKRYIDYKEAFLAQVRDLMKHYNNPKLPVVTGGFIEDWRHTGYHEQCLAIEKALQDSMVELGCGGFVSAEGLRSNKQDGLFDDNIHFSKASVLELGRRYFEAYKRIKELTK